MKNSTLPDTLWWISLPIILAVIVSLVYITSILIGKREEIRSCNYFNDSTSSKNESIFNEFNFSL